MPVILKVSYEDKDLIGAGTIITFGPSPTILDLYIDDDHMRLILEFSGDDKDVSKANANTEVIAPDTLKIRFLNFNQPMGAFPLEPSYVGTIANRKQWFAHKITALGTTKSKLIEYSFYLNRETERGTS